MKTEHERRIVIVDDMPFCSGIVESLLEAEDFHNVDVFNDPKEALIAILKHEQPDFIISDYNMPGMNGVTFLDKVKEVFPHVDAVIMTAEPGLVDKRNSFPVIEKNNQWMVKIVTIVRSSLMKGEVDHAYCH
jgi:CheY-like chemotaxis protein